MNGIKILNDIVPRTNNRTMVRDDEVWIKVNGEQKDLFVSMDDDSSYWLASDMAHTKFQHNADTLLELTNEKRGKLHHLIGSKTKKRIP